MITKVEDIKGNWASMQDDAESAALRMLRNHSDDTMNALAMVVAGLCGFTMTDLFAPRDTLPISQARWLFWFAYRQATNETYEQISERTARLGRRFTSNGIRKGVCKMMEMTDREAVWRSRWLAVKHVIKNRDEASSEASEKNDYPKCKLTLNVPHGMKDKIEIEIKETR